MKWQYPMKNVFMLEVFQKTELIVLNSNKDKKNHV